MKINKLKNNNFSLLIKIYKNFYFSRMFMLFTLIGSSFLYCCPIILFYWCVAIVLVATCTVGRGRTKLYGWGLAIRPEGGRRNKLRFDGYFYNSWIKKKKSKELNEISRNIKKNLEISNWSLYLFPNPKPKACRNIFKKSASHKLTRNGFFFLFLMQSHVSKSCPWDPFVFSVEH